MLGPTPENRATERDDDLPPRTAARAFRATGTPVTERRAQTLHRPAQRVRAGDVGWAVGGRPGLRGQPYFLASPDRAGGIVEVRERESGRRAGTGESGGAGLAAAKCHRLSRAA